jgi:hypothetical protein
MKKIKIGGIIKVKRVKTPNKNKKSNQALPNIFIQKDRNKLFINLIKKIIKTKLENKNK